MPEFEFHATDASGQTVRGTLQGESVADVASLLSHRGLIVSHVALAPEAPSPMEHYGAPPKDILSPRSAAMTHVVGPLVGKVGLSHLLFFFRQMGVMINAGVPPVQCLDTLATQAGDFRLRKVIQEMAQHVREGRPFTAGMQRYPEVFSPLMVSMVRAGEEGGMMDRSFQLLAQYTQQEIQLRNMVRRLTIYPKVVVAASIGIILAANAIISMVGSSNRMSSPLTNPATWIILTPLIVALFLFFRVGLAQQTVKQGYDFVLLLIPYLGKTVHQLAMAKFGRAFSALYKGGVPIPKAVHLAADACGSEYLRGKMYPAADALQEGAGIADTFERTGAFSKIVLDMTRTGETTGNLDGMLDKLAEFYEDDAATRATTLAYIVGVLCLLAVAAYVGYMVISFYIGHYGGATQELQDLQ